jgi:NADH-quinone oxidoreductase subunit M
MILAWLIIAPVIGGVLAWLAGRAKASWSRWPALFAMFVEMALALVLWARSPSDLTFAGRHWLTELNASWIPQFGIRFHLAMDGVSLLLVLLTTFLGILSVMCSWRQIQERTGFFHLNLLLVLAGTVGVFLAVDLFLFYFAWELMVVPMYFLIAIWGGERRRYAALRFFIFTQLSGLLMLLSILGLYFVHGRNTGTYTFDYAALLGTHLSVKASWWLFLGFAAAFLVKLPAVPLHSWLPDAYATSPTAGSVLLAGLLSKTGAYGLLRFAIPLFPHAARQFSLIAMVLAVIGILYGAALAFSQTDIKRLIAYSSISHLGFVLLGLFAWNQLALQGVVMQMLCHGVGTAGLFILAGALEERTHTRELRRLGGLWWTMPRMGGVAMVLALAAVGMPGLGNFIGEFLVLLGTYKVSVTFTVIAACGFIASVIYALWLIQQAFHGHPNPNIKAPDLRMREMTMMTAMILVLLWLGLYPQPELNRAGVALQAIQQSAQPANETTSNGSEVIQAQRRLGMRWQSEATTTLLDRPGPKAKPEAAWRFASRRSPKPDGNSSDSLEGGSQ